VRGEGAEVVGQKSEKEKEIEKERKDKRQK
jgi:hypothetical protein